MRKETLKIVMSLMFVGSLLFTNSLHAQVEKGTILIEPYYGFLPSGKTILRALNQSGTSTTVTSLGPVGLRFNYMINEKVGMGFDGNYQTMGIEYNDGTYNYAISRDVIRFMLNSHFLLVNESSFHMYGNVGVGYRKPTWKYTTDDPNYAGESFSGLIPVAFKLGLGFRYMFIENLGVHAEANLGGGSVANGGLTFAF